jgi:microcystin-dependent protein
MEGILGFIMPFAGGFAPRGWAFCDGSLLRISSNIELFKILGNIYGGDCKTTFALPDLRGRAVVGAGKGISEYKLSEKGGSEISKPLKAKNIPVHTHPVQITITPHAGGVANSLAPVDAVYATNSNQPMFEFSSNNFMASYTGKITTAAAGNANPEPLQILHPVIALNYIICVSNY